MSRWNPEAPESRFWKKVSKGEPDKCWLWQGSFFRTGYGAFVLSTKQIRKAHRMAYEFTYGPIEEGFIIRHTCDNPKCVNPLHLLKGTTKDNMRDREERGRTAKGERGGRSRLKEADIKNIRRLRDQGMSREVLAERYGVTKSSITNIHHRRAWGHVV